MDRRGSYVNSRYIRETVYTKENNVYKRKQFILKPTRYTRYLVNCGKSQ